MRLIIFIFFMGAIVAWNLYLVDERNKLSKESEMLTWCLGYAEGYKDGLDTTYQFKQDSIAYRLKYIDKQ